MMKNTSPSPSLSIWKCVLVLAMIISAVVFLTFSDRSQVIAQSGAGALSLSQSSYTVNENGGNAAITLTRTGGSSGQVSAKLTLADVTTSSADYVFKPGTPDPSFTAPPGTQNQFYSFHQMMALQPDGKTLIIANPLVRLNLDGTLDTTFNPPAFNVRPVAVAVQPDGKIVVSGGFTTIGGIRKNGVARLNSDGSLDTSFDVGLGTLSSSGDYPDQIEFQSDGKIMLGGLFRSFDNRTDYSNVVRVNTDGSLDLSFVKRDGGSTNYALAIQPDQKILVGRGGGVARMNPDGSLDTTFNSAIPSYPAVIFGIALQSDGKMVVVGSFNQAGGQSVFNIARLNSDGTLDSSFNTGSGPDQPPVKVILQPDGKILISGAFSSINGTSKPLLARLNADGSVDSSFGNTGLTSGMAEMNSLLLLWDGKILGARAFNITRFNGDLFVTWANGDSANKTINLPIVDDALQESNETLNLTLTSLTGGATNGAITNATLTILDNDVPPAFTSGPPPQGITKVNYSHTFTASGMPAPTFSVTSGTLPPGLSLSFNGVLSGSPSTAGTFSNITVTASNGIAPAATQTVSITILSGGTLQFSSSTYSVPENGGPVVVTVTRTGGSAGTTGISYNSGTGTAGSADFTSASGTLAFADGETSKTISVLITNDALDEADETFTVSLNSITGSASSGTPTTTTITIQDDDPPPSATIGDAVQIETNSGTRTITFPVTLSTASGKTITFNYATVDGSASGGTDFVAASGTLQMGAGQTVGTITINITGDTAVEPDETFTVTLTNPQNATLARATATGTIIGDDNAPGNPIDLQGFLVYRHYLDFLGRSPDPDGFNFWRGTITQCGSDPGCIEVQRVAASASFFLSIEFKETGYLVERIYKSSYGDATGTSTFQTTHQLSVPIVRLNEFLTDTTAIGQGVIVLQPGWEQALETNKQTFMNSFVQRTRFLGEYPTSMTAAAFVDKLNSRAGNPLSPAERDQLVNDLSTSAKTRAQVLRAIAEHQNLVNAEFNRAFVLMQYFGYLRRNPNDSPDGDYTGYDFWLTKLNQFNGNYIDSEMVKAFLSSIEYRKRFGP